MDTVTVSHKTIDYRQLVEKILSNYLGRSYANADIQNEAIFDKEKDRYLVMSVGWQGIKRVHSSLIHIDIIEGKLWIQCDGTEHGVAHDFLEAGIPKQDVVLGFKIPQDRKLIEFAT
jgi:XisI protein